MKIYKISSNSDFYAICEKIQAHNMGIKIMSKKAKLHYFYIKEAKFAALNILKQDALSIGAELVSPKDTILGGDKLAQALLIANDKQIELLSKKEAMQDFNLKELAKFLTLTFKKTSIPKIMGVVNINDNSFYPSSRVNEKNLQNKIEKMLEDGADIIDIGAISTRPNSTYAGAKYESEILKPIINNLYKAKFYEKTMLSLDSFDITCAKFALENGFSVINDISANEDLAALAQQFNANYVLMHGAIDKKGSSKQANGDILELVDEFFKQKLQNLSKKNVEKIWLDVGIGFGKSHKQCLELSKNLEHFLHFDKELLFGASRKSIINEYFKSDVDNRLAGSLFLHQKAVENGASIIRTHDVYEHSQIFALNKAYNEI